MMEIIANTYFSGCGLLDAGLIEAGFTIGKAFELDETAASVYRHNLGDHIVQCDIAKKTVLADTDCDLMAFTYPCTKYSTLSDLHDTRTGDDLFLHALRHVAIKSPEAYLVENVPGMRAFPIVMEAMTRLPNYYINVFCPVGAETWLPQKRPRLIIFGTKKPFTVSPPECHWPITLKEILEDDPQVSWPGAINKRLDGIYRDKPIISDPDRGDIAPLCLAHYGKDKSTRLVVDRRFNRGVRPYTVREYARLQGVPEWFEFNCSDSNAYKMIGNGVPRQMARWAGLELKRYFSRLS
ncbi:DNA (cytosine-5)-methyltransferase 1 [Rheinheimera pacifica]|uniref:DNA cytosine methyltransferase n=1 Tax=Rheinheimera pacifica TaxID=173990 RepID=UPI00216738D0|nr:DNA cytosine methyltransferase [Rheinheimera pacifica]MCS4309463.1 DNA (cytosine-5)-methyltransferase 1 [Rheinheimera pacifica]